MKNQTVTRLISFLVLVTMALLFEIKLAVAAEKIRVNPTFSDDNWISMSGYPGANGPVYAAFVDNSGNLYIGGEFTAVGDVLANNVAKWDGTAWSALGSGMAGGFSGNSPVVSALAVSGSDLYAGGRFTSAGGVPANHIAKWNGSSWSALGPGMSRSGGSSPWVSTLAVWGTNLYAGGEFQTAGDVPANSIARWNGTSWSALGSGLRDSFLPTVFALAVSGTNLYVGGSFTTAGSVRVDNIAKWNGSSWSALGWGIGGAVSALAVSGSDLYAGGGFRSAGGVPATNIAKWNGSSWSTLRSGMDFPVRALAVSGTSLYAGGQFQTAGGVPVRGIAKWDGTGWSAVGSGMGGPVLYVSALAASGSDLYAGGSFTAADGVPARGIAKWNTTHWSALGEGMGDFGGYSGRLEDLFVSALAMSEGDLYVGGRFTSAGGAQATNIAKWNGSSWSALGWGIGGAVSALAVSGSDLFAGGNFTNAGGMPANRIAKWNGNSWSALGEGMGHFVGSDTPLVLALAVSGNDLYAAGEFTTAGGVRANNIAKWNGSSWSAVGEGLTSTVYALAVSGSDLYAGGRFTMAGGVPANYLAKWNGSSWSAIEGVNSAVWALAISGSDLYAGGTFWMAGGMPALYIAKWNGTDWSALDQGLGGGHVFGSPVYALAVSGSDLFAAGQFTMASGVLTHRVAKWDGSAWSALGSGMGRNDRYAHSVKALAVSGYDLYAGGDFTMAGGKVSAYIARARIRFTPENLALQPNQPAAGTHTLTFSGVPNYPYIVQYATNLTGSPWFPLGTTHKPAANGVGTVIDPTATHSQRFYRVGSDE